MMTVLAMAAAGLPLVIAVAMVIWQARQRARLHARAQGSEGAAARAPNLQLRQRLERLAGQREAHLAWLLLIGIAAWTAVALPRVAWSGLALDGIDWVIVAVALGLCGWHALQLMALWKERGEEGDGVRAEVLVGHRLAGLQAQGCQILHEVPVGDFTIDHVVIGASCVFAVESKSRNRPPMDGADPALRYDGSQLRFPRWTETRPLEDARHQAHWLAAHLRAQLGADVPVVPVLCLPGWKVEREAGAREAEVQVIDGSTLEPFAEHEAAPQLGPDLRRRAFAAIHALYPPTPA